MNHIRLSRHYQWRTALLNAYSTFSLGSAKQTVDELAMVAKEIAALKPSLPDDENLALGVVQELVSGFERLCRWAIGRRAAASDAQLQLDAAKEHAAVALERAAQLSLTRLRDASRSAATAILAVTDTNGLSSVAQALARVPIPPLVAVRLRDSTDHELGKDSQIITSEGPFVVRVMLLVDGKAAANPHLLNAGTVYDLHLEAVIPAWPSEADQLVLDFVTTLPSDNYRVSSFEITRPPEQHSNSTQIGTGQVEFPVAQSLLSQPIVMQMRASFLDSKNPAYSRAATVIGYHQLRMRISDPIGTPLLSRYRSLDSRIVALLDELRVIPGVSEAHLEDFVAALAAVSNYMGICAQQAVYRAGQAIKESEFQRDLLIHLRREFGEDVQEAPRQAGGITDIRYRTVTIELKVEDNVSDREKMFEGYMNQPTQYTSGTAAQLGILCVLDVTEKLLPPAPPQNNIRLLRPTLHGFSESDPPFPVLIAAVIIDGNLRSPSNYSR
jgi:hypothetical protein